MRENYITKSYVQRAFQQLMLMRMTQREEDFLKEKRAEIENQKCVAARKFLFDQTLCQIKNPRNWEGVHW